MSEIYETEVKLYVADLRSVAEGLEGEGAKLTAPRVYERNVRYENIAKTLIPGSIVLRLREDSRVRLTYKEGGMAVDGIVSRLEAEVVVSDFQTMDFILGKLGYFPAMIYEKYRTTYVLNDTEIVLDEMPYGNFVEVEGDSAAIEKVLKKLNLSSERRIPFSYSRLFDFVCANMGLKFNDLTFANFSGITVPIQAFEPPASADKESLT